MASFSAILGGIAIEIVREGAVLGDVPFAQVMAKGNRSGVPRVISVDMNEPRVLSCMIHVSGTTKDDLISNVKAINARIRVGCDLVMQSTDATDSVTLKVLPSQPCAPGLLDIRFERGLRTSLPLSLTVEPYTCRPETLVYQAVTEVPNLVDFDVPGDYPTPLRISYATANPIGFINNFAMGLLPDQTTAFGALFRDSPWGTVDIVAGNPAYCGTAGPHGLFTGQVIRIFGTSTTPSTISNFGVTVIDSTHFIIPLNVTTGGSGYWSPWVDLEAGMYNVAGATDPSAYGGVAMQHAVDDWVLSQINDTGLPRGTYLPFVRMGKTTSGANPFVRLSQTGFDFQEEFAGASAGYVTRRWPQTVAAPAMRVSEGAVSFFSVGMRAGYGGGAGRFDWLAMLPISWGYLLQLAATPWAASKFDLGYDGTAYLDSVAQTSGISTSGMNALGAQSLLFLMGQAEQQPTFAGTLSIWATPRYALWA